MNRSRSHYPQQRSSRRRRPQRTYYRRGFGQRRGSKMRLVIGVVIALFSVFSYFGSRSYNPVTGEKQYLSMTEHQEVALGLQARPQLIQQYGGHYPSQQDQHLVKSVGRRLLESNPDIPPDWRFEFHLLRDPRTINAFALPGGQVFITYALYSRLETEGQLAGVLGHEIGHVVARHGAQRMAKGKLTQGLLGAVTTATDSQASAQVAAMIGQMVNMKYGRSDELQSDELGVLFMTNAGYDPNAMIGVMNILGAASGDRKQPEFFSTHPNPDNRIDKIKQAIQKHYANGLPRGLKP